MDDPLSAVDSRCARHIFNRLIKRSLANRTIILVTHATQFLNSVDRIVVMGTEKSLEGPGNCGIVKNKHIGTYPELTQQGINLSMFGCTKKRTLSDDSVKDTTDSGHEESEDEVEEEPAAVADKPEVIKEEKKEGALDKSLYFKGNMFSTYSQSPSSIPTQAWVGGQRLATLVRTFIRWDASVKPKKAFFTRLKVDKLPKPYSSI
eukprot:sb/3470487/